MFPKSGAPMKTDAPFPEPYLAYLAGSLLKEPSLRIPLTELPRREMPHSQSHQRTHQNYKEIPVAAVRNVHQVSLQLPSYSAFPNFIFSPFYYRSCTMTLQKTNYKFDPRRISNNSRLIQSPLNLVIKQNVMLAADGQTVGTRRNS